MADTFVQTPALMTASEVAAALRLSVRAVWRDLASGRIPSPLKIGRATRWRAAEIADWITAGCPPAARWTWTPKEAQP
jgi:predicted DNA-binding transcriptional regulator AlpA